MKIIKSPFSASVFFLMCYVLLSFSIPIVGNGAAPKQLGKYQSYFVASAKGPVPIVNVPSQPVHGELVMELEPLTRIDTGAIAHGSPIFLHNFVKMKDGRLLFSDFATYKIHMISPGGEYLKSFLGKGAGPGEFPYGIFSVQPKDNIIYVTGKKKMIRFEGSGKYLDETKLKRDYRNVNIVGNGRFIANYFVVPSPREGFPADKGAVIRHYTCSLIDKNENIIETYIDAPGAGVTQIYEKVGDATVRLNFFSIFVSPDIRHTFDPIHKRAYFCLTSYYRIFVMDTSTHKAFIIKKEHQPPQLTMDDRDELISMSFSRQPPHVKKIIRRELPSQFCSIQNIHLLPHGHLAVVTINGLNALPGIDIFDSRGRYLYHLKFPNQNKVVLLKFFEANLAVLEENEEEDIVYREYRIVNRGRCLTF